MSEFKKQETEKTLLLKIQEVESLKAQNGRLIERLQEEIDKTATASIEKEIFNKEIIQIHLTMREVYQQGQIKNSALEKIYNKINEFEIKSQEQLKTSATTYGKYVTAAVADELEQLKLEMMKVQSKENSVEKLLLEMTEQLRNQSQQIKTTQLAINTILKQEMKNSLGNYSFVSPVSDDSVQSEKNDPSISEAAMEKISLELKNELSNNKDDLNLILQMMNEK